MVKSPRADLFRKRPILPLAQADDPWRWSVQESAVLQYFLRDRLQEYAGKKYSWDCSLEFPVLALDEHKDILSRLSETFFPWGFHQAIFYQ